LDRFMDVDGCVGVGWISWSSGNRLDGCCDRCSRRIGRLGWGVGCLIGVGGLTGVGGLKEVGGLTGVGGPKGVDGLTGFSGPTGVAGLTSVGRHSVDGYGNCTIRIGETPGGRLNVFSKFIRVSASTSIVRISSKKE
jgi:hypothetical protein